MVRKSAVLAVFVCLVSAFASAQEAMRVSPSTLTPNDESFLTIFISGVAETDAVQITYAGPGGEGSVEPSFIGPDSIISWVPAFVTNTEGQYQIDVYVTRATGVSHFGPAFISVELPDQEFPPFGLILPEVVFGEATSLQGGPVEYFVASTDGTPVQCTPPSGSSFPMGTSVVTCIATDAFGQTASGTFLAIVFDIAPPVITVPADISTTDAVVTFTVTATDALDADPEIFCSPASGSTFPGGTTTVNCFAVDDFANYGFGSFKVTVTGGAPLITVPDDELFAEATGPNGAVVSYNVSASEAGVITCTPPSGATFPLGTTTVNCSATNAVGTTTASFLVSVIDTTPPALGLQDITAEATSLAGAQVTFSETATDIADGSIPMTCTPPSGSTFAIGTTTVECSATDAAGLTSTGSFEVTVADTTPPTIVSATVSKETLWPPDHKMVPITVTIIATDTIDPAPVSRILSVSSSQPVNGTGDGDKAPDWKITGELTVDLRSERSKNQDRTYTIRVETSDSAGNSVLTVLRVTVKQTSNKP